jgi:hypothetical protein
MPKTESSRQNPKHKKRLRTRLVLDIIPHRIRNQQRRLKINLRQNQCQQNGHIRILPNGREVSRHSELGDGDGSGADPFGGVDSEGYGEGLEAHGAVSFDGFEVVDDCDS